MSSIAGVVHVDGREVFDALLAAIAAGRVPRASDAVTRWHEGPVGLIRSAYATTDEAVGEVQPFRGTGSDVALLFDGRLDNRAELVALLARPQLAKAPDGEIALALHETLGRDFVHRLTGDFAVAIWEPHARRMSLFRSVMGWRPLVWTHDGRTFAFATDARELLLGLGLERKPNEGALGEYLAGRFSTETDTLWEGIERVPQGGAIILENGRVTRWAWHGGPFEDLSRVSMEEHVERFNTLFDQALIDTSRCNGPVTAQLSGGLDSSSVVCRSAELFRAGRLPRQIRSVSARFPGQFEDESSYASAVDRHSGVAAEVVTTFPFSWEIAEQFTADSFMPAVGVNALDTMASACAALRADGRRVLLTGEGGDDWLSGSFHHWPDLLRQGRWLSLFRHGAEQWPDSRWDVIARRTLYPAVMPLVTRRYREAALLPHLDYRLTPPDWIRPEWMKRIGLQDRWRTTIAREGLKGMSQRARYQIYSLGSRYSVFEPALTYAEMQGVEVRHPFHDLRLTRFLMGASGNHLRRHNCRKVLLREAMRGTLPEEVRTRTTKTMFINGTLDAIDAFFEARPPKDLLPAQLGWIDPDKVYALHAPMVKWRKDGMVDPVPGNLWGPVWFAVATDIWLRRAAGL